MHHNDVNFLDVSEIYILDLFETLLIRVITNKLYYWLVHIKSEV
jgi:hypothetical protein